MSNYFGYITNLEFNTTKKFVNIYCKMDRIDMICADKPDDKAIVLHLGYKTPYIRVPNRIVRAYQLPEKFTVTSRGLERYVIAVACKDENPPVPFKAKLKTEMPFPNREDALSCQVKRYKMGKISASRDDAVGLKFLCEIHSGERNFMRIAPVKRIPKGTPTLEQIKEEYGQNLLLCPYDSLVYGVDLSESERSDLNHKSGKWVAYYQIPVYFLRKWDYPLDGELDYLNMADGSVIMAPRRLHDGLTGEEIDPMKQAVEKVRVCADCKEDEDGDIADVLMLIRKMSNMISDMRKTNLSLAADVERLKTAVFGI